MATGAYDGFFEGECNVICVTANPPFSLGRLLVVAIKI